MRNIKLNITKANIKNGIKVNPGKCPIANSILDNVKNVYYVCVLPNEATIKIKNGKNIAAYKSPLPKKANSFIRKFDDGQKVVPFNMALTFKKLNKSLAELV